VKENFDRFISCKNTIDDIHVRLRRTEAEANSTAGVMEAVAESHSAATEVGMGLSHTLPSCAPDSLVACHSPKLNAVHGGRRQVAQRNERGACLSGQILPLLAPTLLKVCLLGCLTAQHRRRHGGRW